MSFSLKDYPALAMETESVKDSITGINPVELHSLLTAFIEISNVLDQIKKHTFYGRAYDSQKIRTSVRHAIDALNYTAEMLNRGTESDPLAAFADPTVTAVLDMRDADGMTDRQNVSLESLNSVNTRVIHGILGMMTEASEAAEVLRAGISGKPVDMVNLLEEVGDSSWYGLGQLCHVAGINPEVVLANNIEKLQKKRFKNKTFEASAANNRDLTAERELLERDLTTGFDGRNHESDLPESAKSCAGVGSVSDECGSRPARESFTLDCGSNHDNNDSGCCTDNNSNNE